MYIGIFTGKIYTDKEIDKVDECIMQVNTVELAKARQPLRRLMICPGCLDCSESRKVNSMLKQLDRD